MVFFRTIIISVKTLRSKLVEIKLGELVIMVSLQKRKYWAQPPPAKHHEALAT
jgi:hypothetical protein